MMNFDVFFLQNQGFLNDIFFTCLVVSQEQFDLQSCTMPHFDHLRELF